MKYHEKTDLCGKWRLTGDDGKQYDATVPGCVHTDIIKENMFWRDNSEKVQWIEKHNWEYSRTFNLDEIGENAYIVFEGLDTYCDIYLNGKKIGECANMFIPHKLKADGLKIGENTLTVHFYSPIKKVDGLPNRGGAFTTERLYTRRIQCTYGWDWVDRFVTCGIFRPVYLVFDNEFGMDNIYVYTESVDKYGASVRIFGETANYEKGAMVKMSVISPEGETVYEKDEYINSQIFEECINVSNPSLWYPNGYGEQPLYTLKLEYDGKTDEEKFGIRTVRVVEIEDEVGSEYYNICKELQKTPSAEKFDENEKFYGFILYVNGIEIMCKGANYVPTEPFVSAETNEKMTRVLEKAKECGVNMIRVWGGGIFESDWLYSECDRLGITVTQDFLMACGTYPEEEDWFIAELNKEAEYAAKKLRNHPCLVWWSGDNENATMGTYTSKTYHGKRAFFHGILPMLAKYDYTRRAFASSPYGGNKFASKTVGTTHNTNFLWNIFGDITANDMSDYKEYLNTYAARFIAEEPTLGMVCEASLREMMTDEDIADPEMKMMYRHTRTNPALPCEIMDYMLIFAEKVLGKFENNEDKLFKLRYIQYEWVRVTLENARSRKRFCNGIIYWMLNDCWPAASGWAFIDYYCRPKASYYGFKRAAKAIMSTIRCEDGKFKVIVSNNGIYEKNIRMKCRAINYRTDEERIVFESEIFSPKNESVCFEIATTLDDDCVLVCDSDDAATDRSFYKKGALEIEKCDGVKILSRNKNEIEIEATKYIHAVELVGDCTFDDNYFAMAKGEKRVIAHTDCDDVKVRTYTLK